MAGCALCRFVWLAAGPYGSSEAYPLINPMAHEDLFQTIAEKYGFSLPEEFRYLWEKGFCTLVGPAKDHEFTRPGNGYLLIHDMEWYSLEEIVDFEFPEYCQPHLPHLVPFAFNGAGDNWCWQTDRTDARGMRVLLCAHDSNMATVQAPNFAGAIYRQILLEACWFYTEGDFAEAWEQNRAFLRRYVVDLAPIFPAQWVETLRELETRAPVQWTHHPRVGYDRPQTSFLTETELAAIEAEQIELAGTEKEVRWMLD